eukprot:comp22307_c0_seq1/m.33118 comp22307_c0_seq1/g.33118  ORF comp22307_c0_seq1/g.33118 comp22307_c0_seq1/m.33118 type:complete len:222 (-) comp22307_c0_seq1:53-718(-)
MQMGLACLCVWTTRRRRMMKKMMVSVLSIKTTWSPSTVWAWWSWPTTHRRGRSGWLLQRPKKRVQFPDIIDFWDAIKDGDLQGVERYLACRPNHVDLRNALGFTPLMSAALLGHFELVAYFVDQGADLNATNFEFCTALHYAVIEDDVMIARYLIEHGADLTLRDFEGKSPIELTEDEDLLDAMEKVLREKGLLELDQGEDSEFGEDEEEGGSQHDGPQSL